MVKDFINIRVADPDLPLAQSLEPLGKGVHRFLLPIRVDLSKSDVHNYQIVGFKMVMNRMKIRFLK